MLLYHQTKSSFHLITIGCKDRVLANVMNGLVNTMPVVSEDKWFHTALSIDDPSTSSYAQHTLYPTFLNFELFVDDASISQRMSESGDTSQNLMSSISISIEGPEIGVDWEFLEIDARYMLIGRARPHFPPHQSILCLSHHTSG